MDDFALRIEKPNPTPLTRTTTYSGNLAQQMSGQVVEVDSDLADFIRKYRDETRASGTSPIEVADGASSDNESNISDHIIRRSNSEDYGVAKALLDGEASLGLLTPYLETVFQFQHTTVMKGQIYSLISKIGQTQRGAFWIFLLAFILLTALEFVFSIFSNLLYLLVQLNVRDSEMAILDLMRYPYAGILYPSVIFLVFVIQSSSLIANLLNIRAKGISILSFFICYGLILPASGILFDRSISIPSVALHITAISVATTANSIEMLTKVLVVAVFTTFVFIITLLIYHRDGFITFSYYSIVGLLAAGQFFMLRRYITWNLVSVIGVTIQESIRQFRRRTLLDFLVDVLLPRSADVAKNQLSVHENCVVIFIEIPKFEEKMKNVSPDVVLQTLNDIIIHLEKCCGFFDIHKIKSVGAVFLAVSGIRSSGSVDKSVKETLEEAFEFSFSVMRSFKLNFHKFSDFTVKIGISCGPITAGILGSLRCQYDIFSDSVNVASRMCTSSDDFKIQISENVKELIGDSTIFEFVSRGALSIKGKGEMHTYYVETRVIDQSGEKFQKRRHSVSLAAIGSVFEEKRQISPRISPVPLRSMSPFDSLEMPNATGNNSGRGSGMMKLPELFRNFKDGSREGRVRKLVGMQRITDTRARRKQNSLENSKTKGVKDGTRAENTSSKVNGTMKESEPPETNKNEILRRTAVTFKSKTQLVEDKPQIYSIDALAPSEMSTADFLSESGESETQDVIVSVDELGPSNTEVTSEYPDQRSDSAESAVGESSDDEHSVDVVESWRESVRPVLSRTIPSVEPASDSDSSDEETSVGEKNGENIDIRIHISGKEAPPDGKGEVEVNTAFTFGQSGSESSVSDVSSSKEPSPSSSEREMTQSEVSFDILNFKASVREGSAEEKYLNQLALVEREITSSIRSARFSLAKFKNEEEEEEYRKSSRSVRRRMLTQNLVSLIFICVLVDIGVLVAAEEISFLRIFESNEFCSFFRVRTEIFSPWNVVYLQSLPALVIATLIPFVTLVIIIILVNIWIFRWRHVIDVLYVILFIRLLIEFFVILLIPIEARHSVALTLKIRFIAYALFSSQMISVPIAFLISSTILTIFFFTIQLLIPTLSRDLIFYTAFFIIANILALHTHHKYEIFLRCVHTCDIQRKKFDERHTSSIEPLEGILNTILPHSVWKDFADGTVTSTKTISGMKAECSVVVLDVVGFTELASKIGHVDLANLLNALFSCYDICVGKYNVEKVRTVGDAYVVVSGLPEKVNNHAIEILDLVFELLELTRTISERFSPIIGREVEVKIGIGTGVCFGGVVGDTLICYEVIGEPVLLAARLSRIGIPNVVIASRNTVESFFYVASEEKKLKYRFSKMKEGEIDAKEELFRISSNDISTFNFIQ